MDARTYPNLNELIDIESEAMKRKERIDERIFKEDIIQTRYLQWKNLSLFIWLLVWFLKLGYPKSVVRYYKCKKEGESEVKYVKGQQEHLENITIIDVLLWGFILVGILTKPRKYLVKPQKHSYFQLAVGFVCEEEI